MLLYVCANVMSSAVVLLYTIKGLPRHCINVYVSLYYCITVHSEGAPHTLYYCFCVTVVLYYCTQFRGSPDTVLMSLCHCTIVLLYTVKGPPDTVLLSLADREYIPLESRNQQGKVATTLISDKGILMFLSVSYVFG